MEFKTEPINRLLDNDPAVIRLAVILVMIYPFLIVGGLSIGIVVAGH